MPKNTEERFLLGFGIAFAIWIFGVLPFLYGPPPRFAETRSPPQSHSSQTEQDTSEEPRGTTKAPFVVKVLPALKTAEETANEAQDRREKSSTDWWIMAFTGAVALFTFMLVGATVLLYRAGERQLVHASDTAERQLRAYVFLENAHHAGDGIGSVEVTFRIKNFGLTPAHNVKVLSLAEAVDWNDGNPTIPVPTTEPQSFGSMAPNGDFCDWPAGSVSASPSDLKNDKKAIYLVGTITYDTVFKNQVGKTNFRYYIGGDNAPVHGSNEMVADDEGNDAT
jgi:hypothetical protein